ncbi:hypothetical protein Poli38472_003376 [Pythium oligandrum]|uniref:TFIIS N-terminal domain-containing protein n=1 Tax=Pythium oligandrum TaxID=41045 RepID=A0A8K1FCQ4_PYTOL|nr:hypothetical protein Poli38472_003376 [Pythium oligandrum]|eukprot:TMW57451.1 hypothetical protein Poli38472_003376 [Pythium oligandrum]
MAAMYTKMTATGSSLIVAPRTISKELEAKITTAIAGLIAKHDLAQLSTRVVRQAVEKEVHVSLANHKEVLKRLMHQEVRRMKAEKAAKRAAPQPWKIRARRDCARKGLAYVYNAAREDPTLALHAMQSLFDLQAIENEDIERLASTYMRALAASWLQDKAAHGNWPGNTVPSPHQVIETLTAVYTVERIGLSHPYRVSLLEFLDRSPPIFGALNYFGWDPATSPPSSDPECSSFRRMTTTMVQCWYAHSLQLSLGCSFTQLLQHLPTLYPYKSPQELTPDEYRDQVQFVTTLVMILTRFGTLRCEPELLPHEYYFLRQHLVYHLVRQDVSTVSEILRALRCFEGSDNLISVRRGIALILLTQGPDGSWRDSDATDDKVGKYHTAMRAVQAVTEPRVMGYAPSIPEVAALLQLHVNADLPLVVLEESEKAKKVAVKTELKQEPSTSESEATSNATSPRNKPKSVTEPGVAKEEDLETQVRFLQGLLEKDGGNIKNVSAALATHVLTTLSAMKLNVDIFKTTGVGRVINKLRKHGNEEVAKSATELVAKWKKDLL